MFPLHVQKYHRVFDNIIWWIEFTFIIRWTTRFGVLSWVDPSCMAAMYYHANNTIELLLYHVNNTIELMEAIKSMWNERIRDRLQYYSFHFHRHFFCKSVKLMFFLCHGCVNSAMIISILHSLSFIWNSILHLATVLLASRYKYIFTHIYFWVFIHSNNTYNKCFSTFC